MLALLSWRTRTNLSRTDSQSTKRTIRQRRIAITAAYHWTEIVRIMSTQKAVTTEGTNTIGDKVYMRLCSEPTKAAEDIYDKLKYKKMPFRKIKIKKSL